MAQVTLATTQRPYYTKQKQAGAGERPARRTGAKGGLLMLGRHQIGSALATLVDFTVMSLVVGLLGGNAELGTVLGATCGAVANFVLGRHWIFRRASAPAAGQVARYAVVSLASLLCNTLGEYVLHEQCGIQYQLARVLVALVVSIVWNFPMQRSFVFGVTGEPTSTRAAS